MLFQNDEINHMGFLLDLLIWSIIIDFPILDHPCTTQLDHLDMTVGFPFWISLTMLQADYARRLYP